MLFKHTGFRIFLAFLLLSGALMLAQSGRSWRSSFPEPDATIRESLLGALFPGAQFQWAPDLTLQVAGGAPEVVKFSGFNFVPADDGNLNGATGLDLGNSKDDYIFKSRNLHRNGNRSFPTDLIVFRANHSGQILEFKKWTLDPADPLAKIKSIQLPTWPILRVDYESHVAADDSFTTIEWDAMFETNTGHFVSRRPFGIHRRLKAGQEQIHMFSVSRSSPSQIQITDVLSKQSAPYQCSDPCVIDGPTLLSQWPQ